MTDEQIIAYIDGELGPIEALRFERAMERDPAIAAAVGRHRRLRDTVSGRFATVAAEAVPDRLRTLVDRDGKLVRLPVRRRAWMGPGGRYAALAATLVAGLVLGQFLSRPAPGPVGVQGGRIAATGTLAQALDTQLASTQVAGAPYRIGVSFRAGDGRYCRSFDGAMGAGLGCRGRDGWMLERFVAGVPQGHGDYRQASSPAGEILAAAQTMMAGDPLDATAERLARDTGWRMSQN